jgi:O-antigen/teichoic acid export membrane protein
MFGLIERLRGFATRLDLWSKLRAVIQNHTILVKNSGAMAIGSGTGAIFGFVYWLLAARWLPPEVIGTASGLLSLMGFIGLLGDAGLGTLLAGEIIRCPGRERGLISAALVAAFLLSLGTGTAILVLSEQVFHLLASRPLVDPYLILGFGITGLSLVIDQAWLGMLESNFRMIRQFIFAVLKLGFLVIATIWFSDISVIIGSWVAPLLISIVVGELLMRRHNKTFFYRPDFALLFSLRDKVVGHYRLDIGIMAPSILLPYLVMVVLSPSANAVFTMLWMIVGVASIFPSTLATVLFPTIQAEPHQYRIRMILSLSVSLVYAMAFGIFIFFFSTDILRVFNPTYTVIGDGHLRMLGFGMIGLVVKFHIAAAARLDNRMRDASVSVFLAALFELASVAIGAHFGGIEGLTWAWMIATLTEAGVLLLVNPVYQRTGEVWRAKTIAPFIEEGRHW